MKLTQNKESLESPVYARRTIRGVLWSKVLDTFDDASLTEISIVSLKNTLLIGTVGTVLFPEIALTTGLQILTVHEYAVPKISLLLLTVHFRSTILSLFIVEKKVPKGVPTIEGIPTDELLEHIFSEGSFKQQDIVQKFAVTIQRFTLLGQKLEDMGVLVRGKNNARILNQEYTRSDIAAILSGKSESKDLTPVLKKISPTHLTEGPTKKIIQERLKSTLPQNPFKVRSITPL